MNSNQHQCPQNLFTLSKEDLSNFDKKIFIKVKNDLKNKYSGMIYDKNYNISNFDKILKKEIIEYNYLNYQKYNEMFIKIEKIFLKHLSKYDDYQRRILSREKVKKAIHQDTFYFYKGNNFKQVEKQKQISNPYKNKTKKEILHDKEVRRIGLQKCKEEVEIKYLRQLEQKIAKEHENLKSQREKMNQLIDDKIKESKI